MRLEVASRKSSHFWRQTDDVRHPCVFCTAKRPAKVVKCGHYELGVVTEETSGDKSTNVPASRSDAHESGARATLVRLLRAGSERAFSPARIFESDGIRGVGRNLIPHHFS